MKKLICFVFALSLVGLGLPGIARADVQIDKGQRLSTAPVKWFVGRLGRAGTFPHKVSKAHVVKLDTTSHDGVTIMASDVTEDALAIGVTMDDITYGAVTRDYNAVSDENYSNWGRVQVWGLFDGVSCEIGNTAYNAGDKIVSDSAGRATVAGITFPLVSSDTNRRHVSRDSIGVLIKNAAATDRTCDVFLNRG